MVRLLEGYPVLDRVHIKRSDALAVQPGEGGRALGEVAMKGLGEAFWMKKASEGCDGDGTGFGGSVGDFGVNKWGEGFSRHEYASGWKI